MKYIQKHIKIEMVVRKSQPFLYNVDHLKNFDPKNVIRR